MYNTHRILVTQIGFPTNATEKTAYLLQPKPETLFVVKALGTQYLGGGTKRDKKRTDCSIVYTGKIKIVHDDFGMIGIMDFSSLSTPGLYQIIADGQQSHPFFIRKDVYLRTAYETFYYSRIQRCGCESQGWHQTCHLDDGKHSDTEKHKDVAGGWHDAGDLRKWVDHTLWQAIGMLWAKRKWKVRWNGYAHDDILDELKWGNQYFLKMQDPCTGFVWHDVGGDESDNHWTDNWVGSSDDRFINTEIYTPLQWKFSWVQAMIAKAFASSDESYSNLCNSAGTFTYHAARSMYEVKDMNTLSLTLALLAATEWYGLTGENHYLSDSICFLDELLFRQEKEYILEQGQYKGFFYDESRKQNIYNDWWQQSFLPYSLINVIELLPVPFNEKAGNALKLYLDNYLLPLSRTNVFRTIPVVITASEQTHDHYRILSGRLKFRYFLPCLSEKGTSREFTGYGQGTNPHILGQAAVLFHCFKLFGNEEYKVAGLKQLEWIHGANPTGVCLVSCRGTVNVYPHSRYVGIIPGGVLNGITGNEHDQPHLGGENYDIEWQTLEYWSPQQAQYLMSICELHEEYCLETDIGVRR